MSAKPRLYLISICQIPGLVKKMFENVSIWVLNDALFRKFCSDVFSFYFIQYICKKIFLFILNISFFAAILLNINSFLRF